MMDRFSAAVEVYARKKKAKQVYRHAESDVWALEKKRMTEEATGPRKISATAEMMRPGDAQKRA